VAKPDGFKPPAYPKQMPSLYGRFQAYIELPENSVYIQCDLLWEILIDFNR